MRKPLPTAAEIARLPPDGGSEFNRLIHEKSPYLLQHARNPVDWYPWGEEAFAKAEREDKPIFLSVGYSTCHWCHVMEHESFENEAIAEFLNREFVPIKVDREERPDVDAVYMAAVQAMTARGGWPMSVFLTPEQKPFWGGTYFPPEDRFGQTGFRTVLTRISELWRTRRDDLLSGAEQLTEHIRRQATPGEESALGTATLEKAFRLASDQFDGLHGGFGGAPKFPRSHSLSFLLRYHERTDDARALVMVERTLENMADGGIHDHLGGGFHRYSTDREWLVPHFEKMLYDQALLARTYLEAYQVTRNDQYAAVARDIFRYVLRDMTSPQGGFYSAEDADSEGVEGKFYVWTRSELIDVLGEKDGEFFAKLYDITKEGNYREEATGAATGRSIPHLPRPMEEVNGELGEGDEPFAARLAEMRQKLFAVREKRVHPLKDDKILTDWNGLMVWALAYGGRVLAEPRYVEAAKRAATFILDTMRRDGRLLHRYRDGDVGVDAYLDDHAFLALGLFSLYEATFDVRWLREAKAITAAMVDRFWDADGKGFFFSSEDGERLIARTKEIYDGAVPSGNSVATFVLLKLGRLTTDAELERLARETLARFSPQVDQMPIAYTFFLMALDFQLGPPREVVLAGPAGDRTIRAMRRALDEMFLPRTVLAFHPAGEEGAEIEDLVPFLREQRPVNGKAAAYVCENYACKAPVTDVEALRRSVSK